MGAFELYVIIRIRRKKMTITINNIEYPSYATLQEADDYFMPKFGNNWAEINEDDRKKLLITATREIEKFEFQGCKFEENQPLEFPRSICGCCENPENPTNLLIACCSEIAYAIYKLPATDGITTPGAENIKSIGIGDTSITYRDGANIEVDAFSSTANPIVKKLLAKYLKGNIKIIL